MRSLKVLTPLLLASSLIACGRPALRVTVCLLDTPANGVDCQTPTGTRFFLNFGQADKYVVFPPADAQAIGERLIQCQKGK